MTTRGYNQTNSHSNIYSGKEAFTSQISFLARITCHLPHSSQIVANSLPHAYSRQFYGMAFMSLTNFFFSNLKDNILLNSHLFLLVGGRYTSLSYHYKLSIKHQITHNTNNGQTTCTYISKHIYMCTLLKKYKYE